MQGIASIGDKRGAVGENLARLLALQDLQPFSQQAQEDGFRPVRDNSFDEAAGCDAGKHGSVESGT